MATKYRTRRDWLIVELVLGYLALATGLAGSGWVGGGILASRLESSGDRIPWIVIFCFFGVAMMVVSMLETRLRRIAHRERAELPEDAMTRLASLREICHWGLCAAWIYGLVALSLATTMPILFLLYAPAIALTHAVGAWENIKARECDPTRQQYDSVISFVRSRLRS